MNDKSRRWHKLKQIQALLQYAREDARALGVDVVGHLLGACCEALEDEMKTMGTPSRASWTVSACEGNIVPFPSYPSKSA
jgi:hypothetical protein